MTKKLATTDITNELKGASVFFEQPTPMPEVQEITPSIETQAVAMPLKPKPLPKAVSNQVSHRDSTPSRHQAITKASSQEDTQASNPPQRQDEMMDDNLDEIRKAVKQLGKEVSTHRFTTEEKAILSDIVYTYGRQGLRTSENEITRIAVNWLLVDYRANGANSVLAQLLERLHG